MEIKCELDGTGFLLQILLLAQHVLGTTMPIIRSSTVLYKWLLPVVFGALVFKLSVWCGAEGYASGLRAAAAAAGHHNPQLHTIPTTWKPKHQIPQAATTCIILSSSWWWAQCCPKHVKQAMRSAIKIHLLHLVGILFPHINDDARSNHIKNPPDDVSRNM